MPYHESVECQYQSAQYEFQHFAYQVSHRDLVTSPTVTHGEHVNVEKSEKIEKHRNQRKPLEIPFRDKQMVNQHRPHRKGRFGVSQFPDEFFLCGF